MSLDNERFEDLQEQEREFRKSEILKSNDMRTLKLNIINIIDEIFGEIDSLSRSVEEK